MKKSLWFVSLSILVASLNPQPAQAEDVLIIQAEKSDGYKRILFKHWIDSDNDGCDTRAEVLIEEAVTKPKIGKSCALTGGRWVSPYDGKTFSNAKSLDVDHLVPLAEAWRSGAWAWTASQRQAYANDLENVDALVAVTLSVNRSKGDRDISNWLPALDKCGYIKKWISIKVAYKLSIDQAEAKVIESYTTTCSITGLRIDSVNTASATPTPSATASAVSTQRVITPGAFCKSEEAGLQGVSSKGITYTCKISSEDNRLRWRQ